jgi:putative ABC transport system substrate-binding protein
MAIHFQRREFISLLGGASTWPFAAHSQQPAMPVVGFLSVASAERYADRLHAFRKGLSETGYTEGRNVMIEYRWAESEYDRLPALATDLVRRQVAVITTGGGVVTARAAKTATATIPIVFQMGTDPVASGLVASLNRPGGNVTGIASLGVELGPKRLELLREVVPTATLVAALVNPANPNSEALTRDMLSAAHTLGLKLHVLHASTEDDFEPAFATLLQQRAGGLVIGTDGIFASRSKQLATLAIHHGVPAIYQYRDFAAAGGLMSYGGSITDPYRQLGVYTARILKGEKPADLPVQQVTKVELIINMKTAKVLGLTVPLPLSGRADELIE